MKNKDFCTAHPENANELEAIRPVGYVWSKTMDYLGDGEQFVFAANAHGYLGASPEHQVWLQLLHGGEIKTFANKADLGEWLAAHDLYARFFEDHIHGSIPENFVQGLGAIEL